MARDLGGWRRTAAWVVLLIATAAITWRVVSFYRPHLVVDDAFISFRFADNLAHGLGLVYNPGERVEGFSNFLWTILLAVGVRCGIDVVVLSEVLSFLAALATIWLVWSWARRLFGDDWVGIALAAMPTLVFATTSSQARYVLSGMETLLFGLLVTAATYLLLVRHAAALAGAIFAAAAMTRPEGVMYWALALGLVFLWRGVEEEAPAQVGTGEPHRSWRASAGLPNMARLALGFAALYAPYFAWRYWYYGYPFPNTYYVKAAGATWHRALTGLRLLGEVSNMWSIWPVYLLAAFGLASVRRNRSLQLAGAFVATTLMYFVYVGGDFLAFFGPRFLMPVFPFLLFLASFGLANLASWGSRWRYVRASVVALGAAALLTNSAWFGWPRAYELQGIDQLMESWEVLGRWIGANTPSTAVLADGGAGIVPFYSRRVNIDMYGLADLHIGHMTPLPIGYKQTAHEKYDPRYVLGRRPDLLVTGLDRNGTPRTAGLPRVSEWVWACYRPLVLLRQSPDPQGQWLLRSSVFNAELYDQGYHEGVFERRPDPKDTCNQFEDQSNHH